MPNFRELVYALVPRIPRGRVCTYGRIAVALGKPRGAREVGWALSSTPHHLHLDAHRVIGFDGSLSGGFAFGAPGVQRALLEAEGVRFLTDGRVDLARHLWAVEALEHAAQEVRRRQDDSASYD